MREDMNIYGKFSIDIKNVDTGETRSLPMQKNLVLNNLFNCKAAEPSITLFVGTGTSQPLPTDKNLESRIGVGLGASLGSKGLSRVSSGIEAGIYSREYTLVFEAKQGDFVGNVSEIGLSYTTGANALFTRSLIKDAGGSPVSISLGASDVLTVTYIYGYTVDTNVNPITSKVIDIGGVPTTVTLRWCDFNTGKDYAWRINDDANVSSVFLDHFFGRRKYVYILSGDITDFGNLAANNYSVLAQFGIGGEGFANGEATTRRVEGKVYPVGSATGVWQHIALAFDSGLVYGATMIATLDPPLNKAADKKVTLDLVQFFMMRSLQ